MTTLDEMIASMPKDSQERIAKRTAELIAEEKNLRELRKALGLTQEELAKALGIKQSGLSLIEKRTDMHLSTLRKYIEASGGKLEIHAKFQDGRDFLIAGVSDIATAKQLEDA